MLPDAPVTRLETYLARLAGQDVSIPDTPITRTEEYLDYIIRNGGGVPAPNAGAHNGSFRGKNLGSTYTSAQADAIDAGTFDGLFVGDYWEMPWGEEETPIKFRIAGFDYFYGLGSLLAPVTQHHAVIIPDTILGTGYMYEDGSITGGYYESNVKQDVLPLILTDIKTLFGSSSIIEISTNLSYNGSSQSSGRFYNSEIDLLSITMILGLTTYNTMSLIHDKTSQLPLFTLYPSLCRLSSDYYTQDIAGNSFFVIPTNGATITADVSGSRGIRPYFCVGKVPAP